MPIFSIRGNLVIISSLIGFSMGFALKLHKKWNLLAIQCSLIIHGFKIRGTFTEHVYRELHGPPVFLTMVNSDSLIKIIVPLLTRLARRVSDVIGEIKDELQNKWPLKSLLVYVERSIRYSKLSAPWSQIKVLLLCVYKQCITFWSIHFHISLCDRDRKCCLQYWCCGTIM
jgi:hypothetical protein